MLNGLNNASTHMLVVFDRIEDVDGCIFVDGLDDFSSKYRECTDNFQQVVEVYDLHEDLDEQLAQAWAFNVPS